MRIVREPFQTQNLLLNRGLQEPFPLHTKTKTKIRMRDEYLQAARKIVPEPYILVNIISLRVKQLRQGSRPLVESLEKLSLEDTAMREIAEGKISYELEALELGNKPAPFQHASSFQYSPVIDRKKSYAS